MKPYGMIFAYLLKFRGWREARAEKMEARSLEAVDDLVRDAKLDKCDLLPGVQCIYFSSSLDANDFKLLEVDQAILDELLSGESLVIRGLDSDASYLCTKTQTFEMKEAETSNTLLLLPKCFTHNELPPNHAASITVQNVEAVKHSYFELRLAKPRLKRLQDLLEESLYDGNVGDMEPNQGAKMDNLYSAVSMDSQSQGCFTRHPYESEKRLVLRFLVKYTFEDLLNEIQSSEEELRNGLKDINACLIDGHWRLLDGCYKNQLINSLMAVINEHSWTINYIPLNELCEKLVDLYPVVVIRHMLDLLGEADTSSDGVVFYKLRDDAVGRYFAEMILSSARQFNMREFVETWQMAVPEGINTNLSQLEGMVLIDQESRPATICYFPASELPEDVDERFRLLFNNKPRWTLEEIVPFLEQICLDKQSIGVLLAKHTRVSSQKGIKVYSSKKLR